MQSKLLVVLTLMLILSLHGIAQNLTYVDVAANLGIEHANFFNRGGISLVDFDMDGDDDFTMTSPMGEPLLIYQNTGTAFENIADLTGIVDSSWTLMFLWADYDNDADRDLFIARDQHRNLLFRNDGDYNFVDVTDEVGLTKVIGATNAACWGDYNNDGWLDLYVTYYSEWQSNLLYKNQGDGTFEDVTANAAVGDKLKGTEFFGTPLAATFLDYNNDGWQDLYVANDHHIGNSLFKNNGDGTFEDVSVFSGTNAEGLFMGVAVGDYDNNGYVDIYASNGPEGNVFHINNGDGTFTEAADSLGIGVDRVCWGATFFDYDNDTDLDLYVSVSGNGDKTANPLFANNNDGTFEPATGHGLDTEYWHSFGNAVGDFDNNGFYDIAVYNQEESSNLYQCSGGTNNWIKIELIGTESNRDGVGAALHIWLDGSSFLRTTHCGISYLSQNSFINTIGVGSATVVDSVVILWPSGIRDVLVEIDVNQCITVTEGSHTTDIQDHTLNPDRFVLFQNYPNPFNPTTVINLKLVSAGEVSLTVYDIAGRPIKTLIEGKRLAAKSHEVVWDGTNTTGYPVASGVYFYTLTAGSSGSDKMLSQTRKMLLVK